MKRIKSARQVQRFLSAHGQINNLFHLRRDHVTASGYQDHRGIKGRIRCMRGVKSFASAQRFCRSHDELRDFLRLRTRHNQPVSARRRRLLHLRRATAALAVLEAA